MGTSPQKNKCGKTRAEKTKCRKTNAARPATGPHCSWIPALPCHRMAADDRFGPTALSLFRTTSAAFAKATCRFMILRSTDLAIKRSRDHEPATPAAASGPVPLPAPKSQERDGGGGRNARATSRAHARFLEVLRQFTLENRRLPLALPQSSGKLRNSHVSLNPLSFTLSRLATKNSYPLVQNLWTMCLPCGSPRKTEYKFCPHRLSPIRFNSLDAVQFMWGRTHSSVLRRRSRAARKYPNSRTSAGLKTEAQTLPCGADTPVRCR
jgi:hypothetical protein